VVSEPGMVCGAGETDDLSAENFTIATACRSCLTARPRGAA
jgi:hypothetical protein